MSAPSVRKTHLHAVISELLDQQAMWSEDPATVLHSLSLASARMLTKLETEQPGALESRAFWRFVQSESENLAQRMEHAWLHGVPQ